MPKLMENSMLSLSDYWFDAKCYLVDPEMRAEFEQHSRSSPITGATSSAMGGGGFDLAGWMAGASNPAASEATQGGSSGRDTSGPARRRG